MRNGGEVTEVTGWREILNSDSDEISDLKIKT